MLSPIAYVHFTDIPQVLTTAFQNSITNAVSAIFDPSRSFASKHPFKATAVLFTVGLAAGALIIAYRFFAVKKSPPSNTSNADETPAKS